MTAVGFVGAQVEADGRIGFIDQVKHPSWWDSEVPPPKAGDRFRAVVLDASREPVRLSALERDIAMARRLHSR